MRFFLIVGVLSCAVAHTGCNDAPCAAVSFRAGRAPLDTAFLELQAYAANDASCDGTKVTPTGSATPHASRSAAANGVSLDIGDGTWVVQLQALSSSNALLASGCQVLTVDRRSTTCIGFALQEVSDLAGGTDGGSCTHDACDGVTYQDCASTSSNVSLTRAMEACAAYDQLHGNVGCQQRDKCPDPDGIAYCHVGTDLCWVFSGASAGKRALRSGGACIPQTDCTWN